jgi:hypothetical protein
VLSQPPVNSSLDPPSPHVRQWRQCRYPGKTAPIPPTGQGGRLHKPLRHLGAWLSPTLNLKVGKRKLKDEFDKILTILRHKSLTPTEYKYVIQSILHSKLRYYLTVVPLTNAELDLMDAKIANVMKRRMKMASSCSSPLLFLPESDFGAELPSIKDTRAKANTQLAHTMLNDDRSTAGKILRIRLTSLRDKLGWTHSPLLTPHLVPKTLWEIHWCARLADHLHKHGATIGDTSKRILRPGKRANDAPIYTSLQSASARPSLVKHMLYWVGQVSNSLGTCRNGTAP